MTKKIDLKTNNKKQNIFKFNLSKNLKIKTRETRLRDKKGRFTNGTGGLRQQSRFNFKRAMPLMIFIAAVGGGLVYSSYAKGPKEEVTTWYRTCLNREPDAGGLNYWVGEINANKEHIWITASRFMQAGGVASCPHKDEDKSKPTIDYATPPAIDTATPQTITQSSQDTTSTPDSDATNTNSAGQLNAIVRSFYKSCNYKKSPDPTGSHFQFWVNQLKTKSKDTVWENFRTTSLNNGLKCADHIGGKIPGYSTSSDTNTNSTQTQTSNSQTTTTQTNNSEDYDSIVASFYQSCSYTNVPKTTSTGFQFWVNQLKTKSKDTVWENFRTTSLNNGLKCADQIGGKIPGYSTSSDTNTNSTQTPNSQNTNNSDASSVNDIVESFYRSCSYTNVPGPTNTGFLYWVGEVSKTPEDIEKVWERFREKSRSNGLACADSIGGSIVQTQTQTSNSQTTTTQTNNSEDYDSIVASFYQSCSYTNVPKTTSTGFQFWVNQLKTKSKDTVWENFRTTSLNNGLKCADQIGGKINNSTTEKDSELITINPYVCNKSYPEIKLNTKDSSGERADACVSAVQFNLAKGDAAVVVTGVVDKVTETAIKNFQTLFKQSVTGILTPAQVESVATIWGAYKTNSVANPAKTPEESIDTSGIVDVAFVSVDGGSASSVISKFASQVKSTPPLSDYTYALHELSATKEELGCSDFTYDSAHGPVTTLSCISVGQVAASRGVPADYIFLVVPSTERENAGGPYATVGSGTQGVVLVHEFAHLIGLNDEYVSQGGDISLSEVNCFRPENGAEEQAVGDGSWASKQGSWSRFIGIQGVTFYKGCTVSGLWRPSENSIMRHHYEDSKFNTASQHFIKQMIRR
jgi:hypothetical protein